MPKLSFLLIIFFALSFLPHCNKPEKDDGYKAPGSAVLTINGEKWEPVSREATYYPRAHLLFIHAFDAFKSVEVGLYIDSTNPSRSYSFESNGGTGAILQDYAESYAYQSDFDIEDAGGLFNLTTLDTTNRKLSGTLNFIGYQPGTKKKVAGQGEFKDFTLKINRSITPNYAECTISGAKTTLWKSYAPYARVTCASSIGTVQLDLEINSLASAFYRYLTISIPLQRGPGTYTIFPSSECGKEYHSFYTYSRGQGDKYLPVSGLFNLIAIDTVKRQLTGTFNITLKNSAQETIQITNGKVQLTSWIRQF
jgi:hypothetical protein